MATPMETRRYTEADILALRPCYTAAQVRAAFGPDEALTLQQIADRRRVPAADRLWVLWRLLPADLRRVAVERIVARAVRRYALPEPSTRAWAERWLSGEDRTEAEALRAWAAARAAMAATARAAAALAAGVGGAEAERASAEEEAPWWAERDAERRRQLADIRAALREIDIR